MTIIQEASFCSLRVPEFVTRASQSSVTSRLITPIGRLAQANFLHLLAFQVVSQSPNRWQMFFEIIHTQASRLAPQQGTLKSSFVGIFKGRLCLWSSFQHEGLFRAGAQSPGPWAILSSFQQSIGAKRCVDSRVRADSMWCNCWLILFSSLCWQLSHVCSCAHRVGGMVLWGSCSIEWLTGLPAILSRRKMWVLEFCSLTTLYYSITSFKF